MNATFSDWFRELRIAYHRLRARHARHASTATHHHVMAVRLVMLRKQCVHDALIEMGLNP